MKPILVAFTFITLITRIVMFFKTYYFKGYSVSQLTTNGEGGFIRLFFNIFDMCLDEEKENVSEINRFVGFREIQVSIKTAIA